MPPITFKRKGEFIERSNLTTNEIRVVDAFEVHIDLMLKDEWYITIDFTKVDGECMATEAFPEYRKAVVEVDLVELSEQWEYLNHYVRHEITHILLWEFFSIAGELCYKRSKGALVKLEEATVFILEHMPLWQVLYKGLGSKSSSI